LIFFDRSGTIVPIRSSQGRPGWGGRSLKRGRLPVNRFARWRPSLVTVISLVALFVALGGTSFAAIALATSAASASGASNGASWSPAISAGGRFVAFQSLASKLVRGDTNGKFDVFVRDTKAEVTARASVGNGRTQANSYSGSAGISRSGRFVAFGSRASNLVSGDTNKREDVFVRDRATGKTERISVSSEGTQANGENDGLRVGISPDGGFVVFMSEASNLVAGDTNSAWDVFVRDRVARTTERVSVGSNGAQVGTEGAAGSAISADGRYVAFQSRATTLVADDTNRALDVFVRDRQTATTARVSVDGSGVQANGDSVGATISADGRFVAFSSAASNLVDGDTNDAYDAFVHDRVTGTTERVSVNSAGKEALDASSDVAISGDGRFVAFSSLASNLVTHDTNESADVFVRDRVRGSTTRVSVSGTGAQADRDSKDPVINADGRFVAFSSKATTLVRGDANRATDVFVRDRRTRSTSLVSARLH